MLEILKQVLGRPPLELVPGQGGDVLLLSMRRVADLAGYCLQYEFEDVIADVTGADRIEPVRLELNEFERRWYRAVYTLTSSAPLALNATPKLGGLRLERTYDLFLPIFNHVFEIFALNAIPNWRERSRKAVCIISEALEGQLPPYLLETLGQFDKVYLSSNPVASMERITGRACSYLPLSVDALRFSPYPNPPQRGIDVLGIGRRSQATHTALMRLAREQGLFYYYDTVRTSPRVSDAGKQITFSVMDPAEHRFKHASLLKRSRYYLASRARANEAGIAELDEISARFFEGAAAGAIMIGEPPTTGKYLTLFDWPDVVVRTPFDAPDIGDVIAELDRDPERCSQIRRSNMLNALQRHDCGYRLRTMLEDLGLPIPPKLLAREARLREIIDIVREAPVAP
jgi:hypothetical protein